MKSPIKVIKRKQDEKHKQDEGSPDVEAPEDERSSERSTRKMASTVKSWIAELQQKKHAQDHSFSPLPALGTATSQNT
jgi:hypothetical protein